MTHRQLQRGRHGTDWGSDDSGCNVLHVDMDAFFAGVELRDRPELAGTPVIVGRPNGRGVVLSATYEARAYGVHSAMPMARAIRQCPMATIVEPSHGKYVDASKAVMSLLGEMTPMIEVVSVDEAFLDVRSVARSIGSPVAIGRKIRSRVLCELGLVCSVGIAPVTLVAKAASTESKPDGLLLIPQARMLDFLHQLPIGRLWGVGSKTEMQLKTLGIITVGDLSAAQPSRLAHTVGKAASVRLSALAAGEEVRAVQHRAREKSIGSERTFDVDVRDYTIIEQRLRELSEGVGRRLRAASMLARQVSLKVRFDDFSTITRSHTLAEPADLGLAIFSAVLPLWRGVAQQGRSIRLIGIRAEQLVDEATTGHQLTIDDQTSSRSAVENAMDRVAEKYGSRAVIPARMLRSTHPDR
jgi:DNA polymerase IV